MTKDSAGGTGRCWGSSGGFVPWTDPGVSQSRVPPTTLATCSSYRWETEEGVSDLPELTRAVSGGAGVCRTPGRTGMGSLFYPGTHRTRAHTLAPSSPWFPPLRPQMPIHNRVLSLSPSEGPGGPAPPSGPASTAIETKGSKTEKRPLSPVLPQGLGSQTGLGSSWDAPWFPLLWQRACAGLSCKAHLKERAKDSGSFCAAIANQPNCPTGTDPANYGTFPLNHDCQQQGTHRRTHKHTTTPPPEIGLVFCHGHCPNRPD